MRRRISALCTMACLMAAGAYGQGGGNAAMTGTVTDPTGAVIVGANLTMTQIGTEAKRTATTNENGQFTIPSLPPANYRLSEEAKGFKTSARHVTLLADPSASLPTSTHFGQSH